jgi:hypothetical protein
MFFSYIFHRIIMHKVLVCFIIQILLNSLTLYSQSYIGHYDLINEDFEFKTLPFIELRKNKTFIKYGIRRELSRGHLYLIKGKYKVYGDTIILTSNIQPKQDKAAYWFKESLNPFSDSIEIKIHYNVNVKPNLSSLVSEIKINDCFWAGKGQIVYYIDSFYVKIPSQGLHIISPISYSGKYPDIELKDSNSNIIDIYISFKNLDNRNLELGSYSITNEKYIFRHDTLVYLMKNCIEAQESDLFNYKKDIINNIWSRKQLKSIKKRILGNRNNYYLK